MWCLCSIMDAVQWAHAFYTAACLWTYSTRQWMSDSLHFSAGVMTVMGCSSSTCHGYFQGNHLELSETHHGPRNPLWSWTCFCNRGLATKTPSIMCVFNGRLGSVGVLNWIQFYQDCFRIMFLKHKGKSCWVVERRREESQCSKWSTARRKMKTGRKSSSVCVWDSACVCTSSNTRGCYYHPNPGHPWRTPTTPFMSMCVCVRATEADGSLYYHINYITVTLAII